VALSQVSPYPIVFLLHQLTILVDREKSLLGKIFHASARDILVDFSLKLLAVSLNYLRPYWIQRLLESLTLATSTSPEPEAPTFPEDFNLLFVPEPAVPDPTSSPRSMAYTFALLAFLTMILRSLAELQHFHHARRIGMRLRSELTVSIFEKALKRKDMAGRTEGGGEHAKGQAASIGKVVSLISDDANRVLRMVSDTLMSEGSC
jgi:ABC-type multidrug transport system fused ATPase/permease subunit